MNKLKLRRGNIRNWRYEREQDAADQVINGAYISCGGTCGKSRRKCLTRRNCEMSHDRKIMKSQEMRYDSWMQTIKQGMIYFKTNDFNTLDFK
jgi:hypothetical protein